MNCVVLISFFSERATAYDWKEIWAMTKRCEQNN